jgi:osmoprotectant transport system permease protein
MVWVWSNLEQIWGLVLSHIALSVPPIIIGFVLSIPLGYWASRSQLVRSILLGVGGVLYTIPSLALLVVVPVILGTAILAPTNVVFGLSIYAVAIMVRSAADAFSSVSDDVRESATAVGYSAWQRFFAVEFPLAGPVLLAGIRVVSVSTVSLVTVGSVIGISSLGNLFTDGFGRNFPTEIITGIVCVLLIAAVFDLILAGIGRLLLPWNRSVRSLSRAAERASTLVTQ